MQKQLLSEYAQVLRMLGNGRLEAMCIDGTKRLCHIRGKMRKKVWVNTVSCVCSTQVHALCQKCLWALPQLNCSGQSCRFVALQGDIILVGLRDYQDEKADVILK